MELWDVCDELGRPTGQRVAKGAPFPPGRYHLAAEVWVVNSEGEILIQQRAGSCEILPGIWGLTTGRMTAGETTRQGAARELEEELGIVAQPEELLPLLHVRRTELIWDVFLLRRDLPLAALTLQKEEVAAARWVTPGEFRRMAEAGALYHYPELEQVLAQVEALCSQR